jgi:hypothetical protein
MYCATKFLIGTSFEVQSMYIVQVFIDCLLCPDHISFINPTYVSFMYRTYKLLLLLLLLFVLYCQESFCNVPIVIIMTSSISTLVDLWNTE